MMTDADADADTDADADAVTRSFLYLSSYAAARAFFSLQSFGFLYQLCLSTLKWAPML